MLCVPMVESFYEGAEKKFELVVKGSFGDLRDLGSATWERVVAAADANVVKVHEGESCMAYLLSESSLLVFRDYVVMITCGQTNLINALELLFEFIPEDDIALLTYERKNEYFPNEQRTSFLDDASRLSRLIDGKSVRFGGENGHCIHLFHSGKAYKSALNDSTVEVLMHGIDETLARQCETGELPAEGLLAEKTGITSILPGFNIDEYAFAPVGYSLNALDGDRYYIIHVTPERLGSYASFETNYDFRNDLTPLVGRILDVFKPRAFDILSFSPEGSLVANVQDYVRIDHVEHAMGGYVLSFLQYALPTDTVRKAQLIEPGGASIEGVV